ncbi:MAG: peptide-methionine (S)-S-oxide reductase MsrA [Proteobacteria bacterium]|nr:peptide-methionine (S)-S-oxide reductase MsrA [Pseudomonadota bacterium]
MSEIATLAGGCFWCLDATFARLRGVSQVDCGYMGGKNEAPTYKAVCAGDTGHAEVIQLTFDPALISYSTLLKLFFALHNPTTLNRQGGDVGTQYRSSLFFHSEAQETAAKAMIAELASEYSDPIVTDVTPAVTFWPAETYHQDYFDQNPQQPYCSAVVAGKVRKLMQEYGDLLK